MEIPCKTCITRPICKNINSDNIKWIRFAYARNFTHDILKKCCILRRWLKRYGHENSYNEYIDFYALKKVHYKGTFKANHAKRILSNILKRSVVKKVLKEELSTEALITLNKGGHSK